MAGYIFVASWEGDRSRVRFGYSSNINASRDALSEANWQRLVVRRLLMLLKEQPCWMT